MNGSPVEDELVRNESRVLNNTDLLLTEGIRDEPISVMTNTQPNRLSLEEKKVELLQIHQVMLSSI